MGLSPPLTPNDVRYSLILDSMVSQGLIASRAFSLDLRSVDSPNGSLIFGGVDTGKYSGSLAKLPIVDPSDTSYGYTRYWINMTSVGLTLPNGTSGLLASGELPVFLDSGGTISRFPNETFFAIGDAFEGALYNDTLGYYLIDCDAAEQEGSVDFGFGEGENGKVISVSYKDFIWNPSNEGQCVLGIQIDNSKSYAEELCLMHIPSICHLICIFLAFTHGVLFAHGLHTLSLEHFLTRRQQPNRFLATPSCAQLMWSTTRIMRTCTWHRLKTAMKISSLSILERMPSHPALANATAPPAQWPAPPSSEAPRRLWPFRPRQVRLGVR